MQLACIFIPLLEEIKTAERHGGLSSVQVLFCQKGNHVTALDEPFLEALGSLVSFGFSV